MNATIKPENSLPSEPQVRSSELLEDAERLAAQLEKKVLDLDSRRQSLQREIEIITNLHTWLNGQRHEAAALVERMKAASSNGEFRRTDPPLKP